MQFVISIVQALGFDGFGTCGWINSLSHINESVGAGIVMLIVSLFFTVFAAGSILMLMKVHRIYRSTGASWAKAQQEFATGVMTNEGVQQGIGAAAKNAFTGGRY